ncbi:hypothetical protein L9F63_014488, partial [Diploptera punctata]
TVNFSLLTAGPIFMIFDLCLLDFWFAGLLVSRFVDYLVFVNCLFLLQRVGLMWVCCMRVDYKERAPMG